MNAMIDNNTLLLFFFGFLLSIHTAKANRFSDDLAIQLVVTQISCGNGNDGLISVATTGGQEPYFYNWSNGNQNQTNADLSIGQYSVTVTDFNGCTQTSSTVLVAPDPIILSMLGTDGSCGDIASAGVSVIGGIGPHSYEWSNGGDGNLIVNLVSGTYEVTVTDQNECSEVASIDIFSSATVFSFDFDFFSPTCHGGTDGAIDITITEGQAPFAYYLNGELSDGDFSDLEAGVYSIFISDANACSGGATVHLTEPAAIELQLLSLDMGLEIIPQNGYPPYDFAWSNGANNGSLTNLSPGSYSVTVSDQNGCTASISGAVLEPLHTKTITGLVDLQLYPNPATDFCTFQARLKQNKPAELSILTRSGQMLYSVRSYNKNIQHTLPISDLEAGIYLVQLSVGTERLTQKLLVL